MSQIYFFTAIVGGALLVIQFILTLIGMGDADGGDVDFDLADGEADFDVGDMELDPNADGHGLATFGQISFRTLVAFFAFFGLGGLWAESNGLSSTIATLTALAGGLLAFYLVSFVMQRFAMLSTSGNIDIRNAVGTRGRVYVPVPAKRGGFGKITVTVQKRTLQIKAVTDGEQLTTGTSCEVTGTHGADVLIIQSIAEEKTTHA